ncbi:ATP-dependent protease La (LON) substrate-binding domain [Teratosphaeria destructans]|uniref:ATP-dependent protease La (LON) substrate-binding domain n=1 Tax=Teratosphaeria destructans TaxID=418781 RepID=A0A9W7W461_9PEZI|nr:ATP-dependent protease La (LON) substrate-binding domain [Teratosphaeria destructans]
MDAVADTVARHASVADSTPTLMEEVTRWDEGVSLDSSTEKPAIHEQHGGRLVATYTLAAQGKLDYCMDLDYLEVPGFSEVELAKDVKVLADILEATQKEVDCQVCYNLMLDPVTTFCGHTLCRTCLARVLDHSLHCPVCRREMTIPASLSTQPSNQTLVNLLNGLCPDTVAAREEAVAQEERGIVGELDTALFICTLGFPNQPTFLRIFEPRYRLMIRRALEGNREFGMLMYNRYFEPQGELGPVHFYHYGTMLKIQQAQILADGTSLIETRGLYRFRVKAHGTLDGYAVGSVERFDDVPLTEEERIEAEETSQPPAAEDDLAGQIDRMSTQSLLAVGQDFIARMQGRSATWLQQRVLDIHGEPPTDAAVFPYWFASVLPISDEEKYRLLPTKTVRERMKITASWIRRIESQRW